MSTNATSADMMGHQMLPEYDPAYDQRVDVRNLGLIGNVYGWDVSENNGTYADYTLHQPCYQQRVDVNHGDGQGKGVEDVYAGITASGRGVMPSMSYAANDDSANASHYANVSSGGGYRRRQSFLVSEIETRGQSHPVVCEFTEPYDRRRKMQTFVGGEVTQEALARKGKTVLHKPELYKAKDQTQQQDNRRYNRTDSSSTTFAESNCVAEDKGHEKSRHRPVPWAVKSRVSDDTWEIMLPPAGEGQKLKINGPASLSKDELEIIRLATNSRTAASQFPRSELSAADGKRSY